MKIVCVLKSGGAYRAEHVYALRDMCLTWMPAHDFICLTDVKLACDTIPLDDNLPGWWSKLELFRVFTEGETLFLDLDTIIRGPFALALQQAREHKFVILRDVSRGIRNSIAMQSSVMFWQGSMRWIYDSFVSHGRSCALHGDQSFLEQAFREAGITASYWQEFTDYLVSYKMGILGQTHPSSAPLVVFHGNPRPWQQKEVPYPFLASPPPELSLRRGWVVPRHDQKSLNASLREVKDLDRMLPHCRQRRSALQGGGNIGIWAAALADKFKQCVTVEPEDENFASLEINTRDLTNVVRYKMALGQEFGKIKVRKVPGNAGAHYCIPGAELIVAPIDALGLMDLDFLQLDVEGYEHQAILGAQSTIKASLPVIVLELKGLGKKYGHDDQSTIQLLQSWGYDIVDRVGRDVIFKARITSLE